LYWVDLKLASVVALSYHYYIYIDVCWHVCTLCDLFFGSSNIWLHEPGIGCLILRWSIKEQLIWYLSLSSSWLRKLPKESSMSPTYLIPLRNQHFQNTVLWSTVMFLLNHSVSCMISGIVLGLLLHKVFRSGMVFL